MNNDKSAIQVIAGAARCPEYSPSMVKALMKSWKPMKSLRSADECHPFHGAPLDNGCGPSLRHGPEADADL